MLPLARRHQVAKNMCGLDEHSSFIIAECLTGGKGMCVRLHRPPRLNRHRTSHNTLADRLLLPAQDPHRLDYALTAPRVRMASLSHHAICNHLCPLSCHHSLCFPCVSHAM